MIRRVRYWERVCALRTSVASFGPPPQGQVPALRIPQPPRPPELTTKRMGDGELLPVGADRKRTLLLALVPLPLGSSLLYHVLQLLQPLLRARDELRVTDFQRFLIGAKKIFAV